MKYSKMFYEVAQLKIGTSKRTSKKRSLMLMKNMT